MKPLILLDLDRTLFKTDEFYSDFKKWILKDRPVCDYYACVGGKELYRHTDFERILKDTKLTEKEIIATVTRESRGKDYLFEDAKQFILNISSYEKDYDFAILTFGQEAFQKIKIGLCSALNNFEAIISLDPKNQTIRQRFADRLGALVDDKEGQALPSGWIEVHLDRRRDLLKPRQSNKYIKISNLNQLAILLKSKILYETITV